MSLILDPHPRFTLIPAVSTLELDKRRDLTGPNRYRPLGVALACATAAPFAVWMMLAGAEALVRGDGIMDLCFLGFILALLFSGSAAGGTWAFVRATLDLRRFRQQNDDIADAQGLLRTAATAWNRLAREWNADCAALPVTATESERRLLFDRAARLAAARRLIDGRLDLLDRATRLPAPPSLRQHDLKIWSAPGGREVRAHARRRDDDDDPPPLWYGPTAILARLNK